VLTVSLTSCATDSCTECTGISFDIDNPTQTTDTLICIDQFDSRGDYDDRITVYEQLGGTCVEQ